MYKEKKLLVPIIEVVEKRLIAWGFPKNKVSKYLGRVLLCLDTLKQKKRGIHSSFFEPLCGRITIEGQKYNFVQILIEAKLIRKVGKYKRGVQSQKYKVIPPCTEQTVEVPKRDLKRLENALKKLSEPKPNQALEWLNKTAQHVSKDGVYICTEALPRNWEAVQFSNIQASILERKFYNKLLHFISKTPKASTEDAFRFSLLLSIYKKVRDWTLEPETRSNLSHQRNLLECSLKESTFCTMHLRNIIDDVCRVAKEKNILLATDGFQIKAGKISPLRNSINSYLIRKGFYPINSNKNHKRNPQAIHKEDLQAMVVPFDEAIQSLTQFIGKG